MRLAYCPYILDFKNPAGTSRGVLTTKPTCLLKLYDERNPEVYGLGEASVFPGLSPEANSTFEYKIVELLANVALGRPTDLSAFSSIRLGFEEALRDFSSGGRRLYFQSPFVEGKSDIIINGLVWMGNYDEMLSGINEKIEAGFRCIKLKIGAIDWKKEVDLLSYIRSCFGKEKLELRVDANGAFSMEQALPRLHRLASLDVHSIEQPIKAHLDPSLMGFLCEVSPVPIALDEELIGVYGIDRKKELLDIIKPAYIILKPSLCGGFSGAEEWISIAEERGIGWWVTSALESNIGLNAIAQWAATLGKEIPQGLGTGSLFTNNFESPIFTKGEHLRYDPEARIDYSFLDSLEWRE